MASKKIRSEGPSSSEPALILLVDDYQDGREMYADALTFSGFRALEASSGLEALQLAIDRLPPMLSELQPTATSLASLSREARPVLSDVRI